MAEEVTKRWSVWVQSPKILITVVYRQEAAGEEEFEKERTENGNEGEKRRRNSNEEFVSSIENKPSLSLPLSLSKKKKRESAERARYWWVGSLNGHSSFHLL